LSLVEKLCTDKQKKSYQEAGRLTSGTNKKSFFNTLSQYCEFEYDAETKKYKTIKLYDSPKPNKAITILNDGIYKYTAPLLLKQILDNEDKNNMVKVLRNDYEWGRAIKMINNNFGLVKYNPYVMAEYFNIPISTVEDFTKKALEGISYYIERTLSELEKVGLIDVYHAKMIVKNSTDEDDIIIEGNTIHVGYKFEKREATNSVIDFINKLQNVENWKINRHDNQSL